MKDARRDLIVGDSRVDGSKILTPACQAGDG